MWTSLDDSKRLVHSKMSELQSLAPAPVSSNHGLPESTAGDQQHDSDQQHPHEFTEAQIEEYKEQDRYLPVRAKKRRHVEGVLERAWV